MQIVIEIPDEVYEAIEKAEISDDDISFVLLGIHEGTPLPEHHGRLIDADNLIKDRVENDNVVILAKIAPTIIEATGVKE